IKGGQKISLSDAVESLLDYGLRRRDWLPSDAIRGVQGVFEEMAKGITATFRPKDWTTDLAAFETLRAAFMTLLGNMRPAGNLTDEQMRAAEERGVMMGGGLWTQILIAEGPPWPPVPHTFYAEHLMTVPRIRELLKNAGLLREN